MRFYSAQFLMNKLKAVLSNIAYPLIVKCNTSRYVSDYTIHGNTVDGKAVGDLKNNEYVIPIKTRGKNIIDFREAVARSTSNTVTITDTGVIWTGEYYFKIPCNIKAGTQVVFSCVTKKLQRVAFYSGGAADVTIWSSGATTTVTKDIDAIYVYKNGTTSAKEENMVFDYIQIETGSEKTEYETYKEPIITNITLAAPLEAGASINFRADGLPALPQFKGTTIYEAETEVSPSGIQVEYY